jgi:hypothetical protein
MASATADIKHDPAEAPSKTEDVADKTSNSSGEVEAQYLELDESESARVLRKVDMRLVPMLALLYLVAFIDRSNSKFNILRMRTTLANLFEVGNAKIAGMTKDLDMPANTLKYNTAVTIFFVPYTLLEVPSNIILKKMRPSYWMAILMFAWGTVMTLMGVVTSYGGLLAARFFLGVTEVCVLKSTLQCQAHFSRLVSSPLQLFF